ncbi:DoxX family protein [Burkholderia sp. AU42008]|uniref:DoxX family protein n=1 Tax=unclassified Burkholderia TaxID=2613784 RepID=UPI000B79F452|nr:MULTISPECIES: DoxX family protein [unclassified Burkholderia]MBR8234756.1 DoxX family protein [Burkholderia sp. AU32357]MBY4873270.1 DoxX family protein [Burkholderia sp. AU42008]OXI44804.1 DoxX family protein [Burkholderia sp. AU17457]
MTTRPVYRTPSWLRVLFAQPWVLPLARVALVSAYLLGGVAKALDFHGAVAEQAHFGLQPAALWAALAIAVEIAGSLCVVFRRFTWVGAGSLGMLTLVAMFVANDFWNRSGAERFMALNSFFEHLGLIAALVLATVLDDARQPADDGRSIR